MRRITGAFLSLVMLSGALVALVGVGTANAGKHSR